MIKTEELTNPKSCLNHANDDEMVFTLLARDICSPATIRFWCKQRVSANKNQWDDPQIQEALVCANRMEAQQKEMHS